MSESKNTLFRKSTLDRVSSPDQLNEYIKVTNPNLLVMLISIFIILISGIFWMFSGVIPKTVSISGVVATDFNDNTSVCCLLPIGTSKRFSVGMDVQISPDYADKEQYGYLKGKVTSIGTKVITTDYLTENFTEPQVFYSLISAYESTSNLVAVNLSMDEWSSIAGESLDISEGTICDISVVVGSTKPYELVFNN